MDGFSKPNTSNSFGVPASPASGIEPGKRPTSSISPLIILNTANERVQLVLGASGGTRITTSVAQIALRNLLFNQDIKTAIDSARLHSQLLPQQVLVEQGFDYVRIENSIGNFSFSRKYFKRLAKSRNTIPVIFHSKYTFIYGNAIIVSVER